MALGGGSFLVQNKVLPGSYINFVSAARASASLSDRGTATMPLELDWGEEGRIFEVTSEDLQKNSLAIFGYPYTHEKLKGLRDLFLNAKTLYAYRLNKGVKAANEFAVARCGGARGNDIRIVIAKNADDSSKFDVTTMLGGDSADVQTVASAAELEDNGFVEFRKDAALAVNAGAPLTGGENGEITGACYQDYLDKIEAYSFNTMGVVVTDDVTKGLFTAFCKRMRDEVGAKFQLVLYSKNADYPGVISVKNKCLDGAAKGEDGMVYPNEAALVYWVTGAEAGCAVNKSIQNKKYDGEFTPDTEFTQNELIAAIKAGEFVLHRVNSDIRVLEDINTMVTTSDTQGEIFKDNQTMRVCDQIANDIAVLFNTKYLGVVPNDNAGRVSLWSDIVNHHRQLNDIRAIENFSESDIAVTQGDSKKSVVVSDAVTVVNAMSKLYMTVTVS